MKGIAIVLSLVRFIEKKLVTFEKATRNMRLSNIFHSMKNDKTSHRTNNVLNSITGSAVFLV